MNKNKGKEIIKLIISTLTMIIIGIGLVGIISNNIILAVTYDWESTTQHSYWTNNGSRKVYEYHTSSSWSYEGNGTHWALCSKCNGAATFSCSGGSHYNGGRCTTCGGVYQTHTNSGRVSYYSITATTHTPMYACTTSGCGVTYAGTAAGHTGGTSSNGGRCTVCNYQYQFAPTYTSCEIKNATKDGYDVYIYGVADQNGVNRVEFPTWTAANGQDDLVQPWPRGTDLGNGTWYYRVNASEHNNEGGTYYTHIYIYDNLGDSALATTQTVYVDKTPPTCTSAEIKNVSQTGYDVYVYGVSDANSGVSKVAFPTWTDANGQDDLVQPWPEGTDLGEGTWYYRVNISDHNNEVGKYITHIYLYDNAGNSVLGKTLETFVDTVPPNPGTITVDKQYTNQLNVTSYVVGASDNESGLRDVLICGGYGNTWISNFKGITATYDSTNNRYYANFNLAEIPNVSTGEVNQGEGTYIFNAHAYDNANNEAMTGTVEVIYDITPPSFSIDTTSCTWRNSPLSVIITAEDPISNGVNSRINETSLQYYISTSSTELLGGEWKNYASGTAFEINPQVSGTYYLFVKNVSDNAGNVGISNQGIATTIDGEIYQCFGTYQFDYEKPTIGKLYMKEGSIDGEDYINNTLTTKNIYVYVEDGTDALSGHVSTTYSINGGEAKLSGKENATELTASGIYFIVVTTIDNSGNVSTSSAYIVNINSVSLEQSSYLDYGIIKPIYKPEWTKIGSTLDIDGKTLTVELKGSAYESEEIDENVNINYSSNVTSTLSPEDIQVFIDGVEVTSSTNPTVTVNSGTTSINETSGKNEITHIVQLSNLEEAIRQTGIPYKEWSGNISLKIKGRGQGADTYTADVLVDEYGNQSMMESDENGTNVDGTWIDIKFEDTEVTQNTIGKMFADFIKPEITYVYSNLDIDYTGKTAKIVFSVTDKYFEQSTLTIDDLRILVDGEEPNWATVEEASSTDNTKPVKELTNITDVTQEINGVQKIVGKEYTITLKNLQQTPNNGYDYSGIVTLLIPQGKVLDTSGNANNAQTITVGVNIPEEKEYKSPSEIFDPTGENEDGLHIGDFVNYDAGTWTEEEINSIQTGLKTSLVTANNSTSLPTQNFQFGGFTAGSSRNGNATPNTKYGQYDYVKDAETGEAITGWRVFDIEGDRVTLISAGNPEDFYHAYGTKYAFISEYILTGNINSRWSSGTTEAENYQKRNWDMYLNTSQYGASAGVLTKAMLDAWYAKYTDTPNANTFTQSTFQKIYQEPYFKYQNMIENYSYYWLSYAFNSYSVYSVTPNYRYLNGNNNDLACGVRAVVSLKSNAQFTAKKTGTKTVTGGNTTTYGGNQTYNVWDIKTKEQWEEEIVVDVVDPIISVTENGLSSRNEENSIDTTEKTVTVVIQGEDKYLAQGNLLDQEYIDKIKVQIEDYNGNIIEDASAQELKITKPDGTNVEDQTELNKYTTRVIKNITELDSTDSTIAYQIVLSNFGTFEGKVTLIIPEGAIVDTSGNENLETPVLIGNSTYTTSFKDSMVDFIRPVWKYVNADTTRFETEGSISFTVKGIDTRLDLENSNLEVSDLKIMKDGELYLDGTNAEDATKISINNDETSTTEKSKTYTITLTGLTETGTYSIVLAKDILIDEFSNTNVGTTITFSNAELPPNTDRYNNITYHVSTNIESEHKSYVHELLTGNTTSYRPSTIGELFNNGENPLFAESMYETLETGETIYAPKSFAGWAEADSNGNAIENGTIYGLYDEIPNSVTHLKAMWQDATVVFVSASTGNNANSGKLPTEPVQDLQTAYNKINSTGTAENNIIVIMDAVEWNNTETLTGNATITNLYAGIDYRTQGAELKISSDTTIEGDITFDNIKLYTDDINNNLIINSNSDLILSRGITTPADKYTFGTVEGGNLEPETIRIEAGKYNSIIAGSTETTGTTTGTVHKVVIGNKRDALVGNNEKLTITSEDRAIYLRALNGTTKGTVEFEMYSGKVKGNIYGGANLSETSISTVVNNMSFYGGEIDGDIYGGNDDGFIESSKITLENQLYSTIKFEGSIFGAGKNEKVTNTSIYLTNFGTTLEPQRLVSIERVENVYIGNSCIELTGRSDTNNLNPKASYTLNNIKSALTIYDNTTLYLQRGFNKVGGFNSYSELNEDNTGTKATMTNTQNKLYTLEGVNLIFAKVEGDLSDRNTEDIWGDVNGMTSFGLYTVNENGEKQYDEDLFKIGTYVEGREKTNHDIAIDGFYKSFSDGSYEIIGIIDNGTNYDWILGEKVKKYEVQLIASKSEKDGTAELELDYNYLPEATYEITGISTNSLVNANNININLIDPLTVPITSQDANNTFGLTVETIESGWYSQKTATIYKDSIEGDALFEKDNSTSPGTIRFKIHNSTNITEENDLGYINLLLTGTNPNGESFDIVVAVNLKTVVEESLEVEETEKLQYIPTFTNKEEKELNYTTDSKVDITYTMYKAVTENPYSTGDYRVLSSTMKLPAGTRITMNDRAKNKVYYYHVTGNETEYRLSDFIEMDSLNSYYTDSDTYYHQTDGYVLEKYDISIDFLDANISSNQLSQEIYLELRSADGAVKYDNGDTSITYSLYYNKNAIMEETINNEGQTYLVSENNEIQFTIDASLIEKETANNNIIMDTKYYDKMEGIIVEIIDEHGERVKIPENGEIKIVNANDTTENYLADSTGVIRIPLMQGLSSITKNYKMIIDEQDIASGNCTVNIYFFASDNGKHMGNEENISKQFNITFGEEQEIGIKVEATNESRVINQETGLNLEGNSGIDMKITVEKPITESNIRVELYKRDETYTDVNDESTYTGTSYTLVDLKDYLDGTWKTPEQSDSLLKSDGNYQYVIMSRKIHTSLTEIIDLKNAIKENIATGEYKLVIKLYERNTLVETLRKTFIITK